MMPENKEASEISSLRSETTTWKRKNVVRTAFAVLVTTVSLKAASALGEKFGRYPLLVSGGNGISIVDSDNGLMLPVKNVQVGYGFDVSDDGENIIIAGLEYGRKIIAISQSPHEETVVTSAQDGFGPVISPDGFKVAYGVIHGEMDSFLYVADGSTHTRIGEGENPTWSPDGKKIAFQNKNQIFIADPDGTNIHPLLPDARPDQFYKNPTYSPDGKHLAYVILDVKSGSETIYIMDTDGNSSPTLLTDSDSGTWNWEPAYSPDGNYILFKSNRTGTTQLFRMNADGTHVVQISHTLVTWTVRAVWSPDGKEIAYAGETPGGLYVVDNDGEHERLIRQGSFVHIEWYP